ncbi:hypothetical protein BDY19DRAFT_989383 [Irpex rosettiformis]|uniref:Uncharacterized protein n=1 Tax=Irpex rosettiformis TaxID=378272 RepID=A0ACB8UIF9_9APHY|nr:hypothetical protein BDY19DRAFT_989383 [Irpex rosettiformis]
MDFWPTRYSEKPRQYKRGERRSHAQGETAANVDSCAYPVVEQGSVAAANLIRHGRRVEWTFLGQNDTGRRLHVHKPPVTIFPATYSKAPSVPALSASHKAQQGAQFLRTYYPDVDIAADVICAELTEDARLTAESMDLESYSGNKLAFVAFSGRTKRMSAYLAFPMGPTGRDLNISPLTYNKRDHVTFQPSSKAVKTFDTPIEQIVGYHDDAPDISQGTYMAVRTIGSTYLTRLQGKGSTTEDIAIDTLATWTRSHTDQRHIVDLMFPSLSSDKYPSILIVTDHGRVYQCFADTQRSTYSMYTPPVDGSNDMFWRIIRTSNTDTLLYMSSSTLSLIDFRSKSESLRLFSSGHEPLTCAEVPDVDHMTRVLTTSELVWFDERFPQKPLISYRHGRQNDRTLQVHTMSFRDAPLTFLTSSKNNLVTIYDVSENGSGLVRTNSPAYSLPSFGNKGDRSVGSSFVRHPSDTDSEDALLLRLSANGSIHRLDVSLARTEEHTGKTNVWSEELQEMALELEEMEPVYGQLGGVVYNEVDLEPVVQRIFALDSESLPNNGETVYNTLENMHEFWSTLDEPVENMVTATDVAFRCGNEPGESSRADFFTQSKLNSSRGYRALVQHRIPLEQVAQQAAWHHDIHPSVRTFLPELDTSPEDMSDQLKVHNLQMDDYRTGLSIRREGEAREQLTLDLSLSTDIYAPHPIKPSLDFSGNTEDDLFETMSRATEAMSIGVPEPPPLHFGFLRPDFSRGNDHYAEDKEVHRHKIDQPLGVRLLLKDWELEIDPGSYVYYDPYNLSGVGVPRPIRPTRLPPINETAFRPTQQTQSQKAPPVIASSIPMGPPPIISTQLSRAIPKARASWQSQEVIMAAPLLESQPGAAHSQNGSQTKGIFATSTQVLPGPFGGRPAVKKKAAKKRLGGF